VSIEVRRDCYGGHDRPSIEVRAACPCRSGGNYTFISGQNKKFMVVGAALYGGQGRFSKEDMIEYLQGQSRIPVYEGQGRAVGVMI